MAAAGTLIIVHVHVHVKPDGVEAFRAASLLDVRLGDRLLVCSDGLTDLVDDERIRVCLDGADPDVAAHCLVDAALAAGGVDNVT